METLETLETDIEPEELPDIPVPTDMKLVRPGVARYMNIYPRCHAGLAVHSHDLGPELGRLSGADDSPATKADNRYVADTPDRAPLAAPHCHAM